MERVDRSKLLHIMTQIDKLNALVDERRYALKNYSTAMLTYGTDLVTVTVFSYDSNRGNITFAAPLHEKSYIGTYYRRDEGLNQASEYLRGILEVETCSETQ